MKWIEYAVNHPVNTGTEDEPVWEDNIVRKSMGYSEKNLVVVLEEAYRGEYTIEDDGLADPVDTPSQWDMIEAQVTYTAMMTDTLLEV